MDNSNDPETLSFAEQSAVTLASEVIASYWLALKQGDDDGRAAAEKRGRGAGIPTQELQLLNLLHEADSCTPVESTASYRTSAQSSPAGGIACKLSPNELLNGNLRILAALGHGGMGEVYVAWHLTLECEVVIKVVLARALAQRDAVARFKRSVQAQARIGSHSHIAATMDAFEQDGRLHLVMEYVPGVNLADYVRSHGPLSWREACEYVRQTSDGLAQAHEAQVFHRDIKPANLIRTAKGIVKIVDWGLARCDLAVDSSLGQTETGVGMGSSDYLAPEQARDAGCADGKSDIYGLGCTFFFLLAGKPPFAGAKNPIDKLLAHESWPPPSITQLRPDVPFQIELIIRQMMAKLPQDRPHSARAVKQSLERMTASGSSPIGRRAAMGALGVALGAAGYKLWWVKQPEGDAGGLPSPAVPRDSTIVDELKISFVKHRDAANEESVPLVHLGTPIIDIPNLRVSADGGFFRVWGDLSSPQSSFWIWIDTRGQLWFSELGSDGRQIKYPTDGKLVAISGDDPAGTHALLLLTITRDTNIAPAAIETTLKAALAAVETPPSSRLWVWCEQTSGIHRGPGETLKSAESYVSSIQRCVPADFRLVAAILLPAESANNNKAD